MKNYTILVDGIPFFFIETILPELDDNGSIIEYKPTSCNKPKNKYGNGPFCKFKINSILNNPGIYIIFSNNTICYIGKCSNLSERFGPHGYGTIYPKNCEKDGQSTNCKVNNAILNEAKQGRNIDLWFHPCSEPAAIEQRLIALCNPPWNRQHNQGHHHQNIGSCMGKQSSMNTTPQKNDCNSAPDHGKTTREKSHDTSRLLPHSPQNILS